jgi:hypothetical protein
VLSSLLFLMTLSPICSSIIYLPGKQLGGCSNGFAGWDFGGGTTQPRNGYSAAAELTVCIVAKVPNTDCAMDQMR